MEKVNIEINKRELLKDGTFDSLMTAVSCPIHMASSKPSQLPKE